MIERITNNGMYITFFSCILSCIAFSHSINNELEEFKFYIIMAYILLLSIDGLYLKLMKIVHINKVEMMISGLITVLLGIHLFITPLSMHFFIWPFFAQLAYRIKNHIHMENVNVHSLALELKVAIDIQDNAVIIKGSNQKYEVSVKTYKKDNIYLEKDCIVYRNSKLKIAYLTNIQDSFQKNILDFTDEELKLAEMYTT